ncbi:VOC family protein [Vibrio sp. Y2-5]|uniref:VOC family protein n=1 Tax=Vibrio sp. Y2-5 TaxID=2743977 RepID=UPI00166174E7|nr:VOC family protein [Vibrio sp. Y2-5]MBD0786274.1 VOC family protein [Vibrio sp. Y2-5]
MFTFDSFVLYVKDIETSKAFYSDVFDCEGQVLSPTFVYFPLEIGTSIALKQLATADPSSTVTGGGTELSLLVKDSETLHQLFNQWQAKGVKFLQVPTNLVFGHSAVAIDPDGHRIRLFVPNQ